VTESAAKTVLEVLNSAAGYLASRQVEDSRIAVELLLARLLKCKRLEVPLRGRDVLPEPQLEAMRRGVKRLAGGEPVQYVLGQTDFMGHIFKTDRRALIPRPETELLVEAVLKCESLWSNPKPVIADVGTGSGCIAVTLALARPQGLYAALDISEEALALARENAAALGVADRVGFVTSELPDFAEPQSMHAVISNPPYIATRDWEALPVHIRDHEPRQALDGGSNGLTVVETVIQDATIVLKIGGFLFMEIGYNQGAAVRRMFEDFGFSEVEIRKDTAGLDRIAVGALAT
jgi:release factor glutamine methyltransferase